MRLAPLHFFLLLPALAGCSQVTPETEAPAAAPPRPAQRPHVLTSHGQERVDEYYWLREREDPEVIAYLEQENAWLKQRMAHTEGLQAELFEEIKGRIKQNDSSVPAKEGEWYYYSRYEEGMQYPYYCRKAAGADGPVGDEQIMLDVNVLAEGHDFFSVGNLEVSPDGKLLCWAEDARGRRIYKLRFKDLESGEVLADEIADMAGDAVWANDNRTVFYVRQDLDTLRSHLVLRHTLGDDPSTDALIFDETDDTFYCGVDRSLSGEYLFIESSQTITDEVHYLKADDPMGDWQIIQPRSRGLEYSVEHAGENFLVRTNHEAENFQLMLAPIATPGVRNWNGFIAHRAEVYLGGFVAFNDFLVVSERADAQTRLRVLRWDGSDDHYLEFDDPVYVVRPSGNRETDSDTLRFAYESLTTPDSVFDYDMAARTRVLRKQEEVLGGFDAADYVSERIWVDARDGARVPVSLVMRRDQVGKGPVPLLLYAYGSYGASMDPYFSAPRLSLLDRGFAYAIAHIRGGQEMGRSWYEDGKLMNKRNTFFDFVDVGRALVASGRTAEDRLFAQGGSAGGLLMGAILNDAPELWRGVVAQVPFVDVITTMEDDTIPLTTFEYDEWGNPADAAAFEYMMSYSPYDNVGALPYPDTLVTTGLHDSQVQYWEPAKWVPRLRDRMTGDGEILFRCEMNAGHGGASGRFRRYKETALVYAFLLDRIGDGV